MTTAQMKVPEPAPRAIQTSAVMPSWTSAAAFLQGYALSSDFSTFGTLFVHILRMEFEVVKRIV